MENLLFYLIAYLVGGIPFGYLLAKRYGINVKEHGSGNIGATNVLRVLKEFKPEVAKKVAILTLVFDALKGAVIILIAKFMGVSLQTQYAIAVFAVIGHCFSPFLKFQGGKGVATTAGALLVLLPIETLIGLIVWFVMAKTLKISSISSLVGILAGIASSYIIHPNLFDGSHAPLLIIGFIVFYKHIPNIVRLIKGEEKRV
ncbi:MAG: glycerol-3-phosphate 1-O-acyltransferase PlsY [Epsilonproteobacteria bacterium]|nr:glycerol-3-phosphate 1-O-acyltransferase PlsY [Campylobacterota bacterium]